jgi:acetylornithine deacetylase/succinyl-diaminopimelate desuccinylase-like protein
MSNKTNNETINETINPETIKGIYETLMSHSAVQEALSFLKDEDENTLRDQIELTEIPAPTFQETERGKYFEQRLQNLGLENVHTDEAGNVFGTRPGTGNGPKLIVSAHLDTVFPADTDIKVKKEDGKIYAPGIADDGRGLAVVLSLAKVFKEHDIQLEGDIIFTATVGEEGLGDLYGVKQIFNSRNDIDGFISVEPGSPSRLIYLATGSRRYSITYKGPGGHSYGNFGVPSALHAMGRAIGKISEMETPEDPKTTFNVGTAAGGTSVNTIAAEANMVIDMRSTDPEELNLLEERVLNIVKEAAASENKRWNSDGITVDIKKVGDRPAGSQPKVSPIVQAAYTATKTLGLKPELGAPVSTDSNVPISLGIPAVTLGGGGSFSGAHTLNEYFDPTDAFYGPQQIFLTVLGLAGVAKITEPLLEKRNK